MGRPKGDQKYWGQVEIIEENKWKCKHCGQGGTGFPRLKAHLDKTKGKGIVVCPVYQHNQGAQHINTSNSIDPQEDMYTLNLFRGTQGMMDTVGGSINHQSNIESSLLGVANEGTLGMIDTIGVSINHQADIESSSLLGGTGGIIDTIGGSINQQPNVESSLIGNITGNVTEQNANGGNYDNNGDLSKLDELVSNLTKEELDFMAQLQWLESRGKKRRIGAEQWLDRVQKLKKRAIDMKISLDLFGSTVFPRSLEDGFQDLMVEKPLVLSNEFVGKEFEQNVELMWKLLEDDKVFIIGIQGMGGVGKTLLATYMENEIKRKRTFENVFWVTVSEDFNILRLQHNIAERIGVKLQGDDEKARATILTSELEKLEKSVLILDDVWKYIDLQKLGIPLKLNGIKLIITTRLKHVCLQMDCLPHNIIEMYPLSVQENLELLLLKLGNHGTPATLPTPVLSMARCLAQKLDGLPLGTSVMARTLKGRNADNVWWLVALSQFENMEMGQEITEEVLTVLKRSYDNLTQEQVQKCFLYSAQLPDCFLKEDLVRQLIESGALKGKRSFREIFYEGLATVDKLIDHSLLLAYDKGKRISMHGLMRNMAWHILKPSNRYMMVKCHQGLRKIPHLREWTEDLKTVSMSCNQIAEIPEGTSPICPSLTTLILSENMIRHIPECFFTRMSALTLLDLSFNPTLTCLPNSLSNLKSLTSLVLMYCSKLKHIPPLGELQALSILDISDCAIHQVPEGLENLKNLKWLDLSQKENSTMITIPEGILSGLTNMQYLDLRGCAGIKVEDVQRMTMLECFAGSFVNQDNYDSYRQNILDNGYGPTTYAIHFGKLKHWRTYIDGRRIYLRLLSRTVRFGDCQESRHLLPRDLTYLNVSDNNQWVSLCLALSGSPYTKNIEIEKCTKLRTLFCLSTSCSLCTNIQNLESLYLNDLRSLTAICKEDVFDLTQSLSRSIVFSHLKYFSIWKCHAIETLLRPGLVTQLQNLESISVVGCNSMKEIFAVNNSGDNNDFNVTLPKLTTLELRDLPELTTVCRGILVCGSPDLLDIFDCPKLESFPVIRACLMI